MNERGQAALGYFLYRCWVSEYTALPNLDANATAIQSLKLEFEGWSRDVDTAEPSESS